jgi:hypothetical protein
MRVGIVCCFVILGGIAAAQETNFPVGPQYLMTNGSPLFARPIATPSLSLEPGATTGGGTAALAAENEPFTTNPVLQGQADLFPIFYGVPRVSVIEISAPESSSRTLPTSITDVGVTEMTDLFSLRQRGFGVTLPEAASYWKQNKRPASHVYTNADIERLHRS